MNKVGKSKDGENVFYFVFYSLDKMWRVEERYRVRIKNPLSVDLLSRTSPLSLGRGASEEEVVKEKALRCW